jgi:L-malate glycosyltransferase
MVGSKNKKEINEYFQISDFFILPTLHESFGVIIAEAMACGLPVIVGDKTAPIEFVDDECGLKVNPENINEIAGAMEFMINNFQKYDPDRIRKKITEKFSFEVHGSNLHSIYQTLI